MRRQYTPNEIKRLRKRMGFTLAQMAKRIDVALETYHRWEKGSFQPNLESFLKLQRIEAKLEKFHADIEPAAEAAGEEAKEMAANPLGLS